MAENKRWREAEEEQPVEQMWAGGLQEDAVSNCVGMAGLG